MNPIKIIEPNSEEEKKAILSEMWYVLNESSKMSLAYVNEAGQPVQSLMLYVIDDELNLYFGTLKRFPKYDFLTANPIVSILIEEESDNPKRVVTIKGVVDEEIEGKDLVEKLKWFTSKNKCKYYMKSEHDFVMFKVKPMSIRLVDGTSGNLVRKDVLL